MPNDTTAAQAVAPDTAAELRDLRDRLATVEHDIGVSFKARDFEIEAAEDRLARIEKAVADLVEAGTMRRAEPKGEAALAETERRMLELDGDPAHDVAFDRLLDSPVDAIGQLITVGARVTFSAGLGKGLEVGTVVMIGDTGLTIDDGTATPWRRGTGKVIVLPAGFGP